jgi:hypothetical protein
MNTLTENTMQKARSLIGTTVEGHWVEHEVVIGKNSHTIKHQNVDPEAYKKIEASTGFKNFRIFYHGGMYTQDIRSDRINFQIDKDFIITEVYIG